MFAAEFVVFTVAIPLAIAIILSLALKPLIPELWMDPVLGVTYLGGHLAVTSVADTRADSSDPASSLPWCSPRLAEIWEAKHVVFEPVQGHDWLPATVAVALVMVLLLPLSETKRRRAWPPFVWLALMISFAWRMVTFDLSSDEPRFGVDVLLRSTAIGFAIWLPGQACAADETESTGSDGRGLISLNVVALSMALTMLFTGDVTRGSLALIVGSGLAGVSLIEWFSGQSGARVPRIMFLLLVGSLIIGLRSGSLSNWQSLLLFLALMLAILPIRSPEVWGATRINRASTLAATLVAIGVLASATLFPTTSQASVNSQQAASFTTLDRESSLTHK